VELGADQPLAERTQVCVWARGQSSPPATGGAQPCWAVARPAPPPLRSAVTNRFCSVPAVQRSGWKMPSAINPAAALLRFSRGAGLPEPLPDALGVAIKLPDAHGPGADQDLLLTSSSDRPLLRRLLFPARSFLRGAFSTALPCPTSSAASGSCSFWSQFVPAAGGPTIATTAGDRDDRRPPDGRPDRHTAVQPLDHRIRDPPIRLAQPAARRRLPGEPTRS
jgi:hypothetical protein